MDRPASPLLRDARHVGSCRTSRMSPTPTRRTARCSLLGALYGAGVRHFDVASLTEIEDARTIPEANMHFMPVSRARPFGAPLRVRECAALRSTARRN